jgi:hypothetical protein
MPTLLYSSRWAEQGLWRKAESRQRIFLHRI